jgi:purine-binding chemotaxis protein CheW
VSEKDEAIRHLLRRRAKALARRVEQGAADSESLPMIEFLLAGERYGIEPVYVREVYPLRDFTALPGLPPFVLGVVNVRGEILSVVNLKKFFDLPEAGLGQLNKLIILHNDQMEFGILADEILGTRTITFQQLQPAPPTLSGIGAAYLRGVTGDGLIVLDGEQILNDEKIVVHQGVE